MLTIKTAQMNVKPANGERCIDITVKAASKCRNNPEAISKKEFWATLFAPTWKMVIGLKRGEIDEKQYEKLYYERMRKSFKNNAEKWNSFIELHDGETIILKCYCKKGDFCHRHLLKKYLAQAAVKLGYEAKIVEEV